MQQRKIQDQTESYHFTSFYQVIRLLSRKNVNKYLYLYLYLNLPRRSCQ